MEDKRPCGCCKVDSVYTSVKKILIIFLLLFTFSLVKAQNYDSLRVSLLTVAPHSKAVWTIFGHTALRLYDPVLKIDMVLNWGTFDSTKPNFIMHFVQGKTDYYLTPAPFEHVMKEHALERTMVTEQILNIPENEKENLLKALQINLLPRNTEYRYSFVFDNCTTRPRDIIEKFCGGILVYPQQSEPVTLRNLIHQCSKPYPWTKFGIDCVIGNGADSLITFRNELFLPEKLMDALNNSVVKHKNGDESPIVLSTEVILQSTAKKPVNLQFWNNPLLIGILIFVFYLSLVITGYIKKFRFRFPFALLFFIASAGGCIVTMLSFFSLHPCVQSNWNILWLHPLHFIAFAGFFFKKSYQWIRWYHAANFVLLSCFLLGWNWIPQELNIAFIPFILCLWVISGLQIIILKQKRK